LENIKKQDNDQNPDCIQNEKLDENIKLKPETKKKFNDKEIVSKLNENSGIFIFLKIIYYLIFIINNRYCKSIHFIPKFKS